MIVKGVCAPKFDPLKKFFKNILIIENGAGFSIVKNKDILVNIYGGLKNKIEPWDENTIVNTFSLSKGIYIVNLLKKKN